MKKMEEDGLRQERRDECDEREGKRRLRHKLRRIRPELERNRGQSLTEGEVRHSCTTVEKGCCTANIGLQRKRRSLWYAAC